MPPRAGRDVLVASEEAQRSGSDVRTQRERLHGRDQAVPAERHGEPRDPRGRDQVAVVVVGTGVWWLVSARRWFTGPKVQGTPEELAAIERELGAV